MNRQSVMKQNNWIRRGREKSCTKQSELRKTFENFEKRRKIEIFAGRKWSNILSTHKNCLKFSFTDIDIGIQTAKSFLSFQLGFFFWSSMFAPKTKMQDIMLHCKCKTSLDFSLLNFLTWWVLLVFGGWIELWQKKKIVSSLRTTKDGAIQWVKGNPHRHNKASQLDAWLI